MSDLADKIESLAAKATLGDLATAEGHTEDGYIECPACSGVGEVEYDDYCNFDHKALGVQFYGIGNEFGAHEELWSALVNNLPAIIAALRAQEARPEPSGDLVEQAKSINAQIGPFEINVLRREDYSGEHREWYEPITFPKNCAAVEQIVLAVLSAIAPALEAKGAAQRHAEIVAWLRTTNYCCAMGDTIADDLEAQEPGKA